MYNTYAQYTSSIYLPARLLALVIANVTGVAMPEAAFDEGADEGEFWTGVLDRVAGADRL
jgi:hypothetical protein